MTTSNNLEVRNAQVFGDSWALGQVSGLCYFRTKQIVFGVFIHQNILLLQENLFR